jgi:hypothetical protein
MSKFEWMELETLSSEIAHTQTRLDAARATKNLGLAQLLERELAAALKRRAQVLADITKGLGFTAPKPKLVTKQAGQPVQESAIAQPHPVKTEPQTIAAGAEPDLHSDTNKGVSQMWDKLTRSDIERAKRGLATRRSEILARHAEELKALEADQNEVEVIEKAIAAFTEKFNLASTAAVIPLEAERVSVQAE